MGVQCPRRAPPDMEDAEMTQIVPFGKYKGQPVEVMQQDHQYVEWLMAQGWFRERFGGIYTMIINNFGEPAETPEHNALQAKFLNDDFCRGFINAAIRGGVEGLW